MVFCVLNGSSHWVDSIAQGPLAPCGNGGSLEWKGGGQLPLNALQHLRGARPPPSFVQYMLSSRLSKSESSNIFNMLQPCNPRHKRWENSRTWLASGGLWGGREQLGDEDQQHGEVVEKRLGRRIWSDG